MKVQKGLFISLEGIDGSGKSTQSLLLEKRMREAGHGVIRTREPGGSPGAEEIRRLLVEGAPERWSAETELLLFTAARRDHLESLILPALERGESVITDRFADSTRIYQGATRGDLRKTVDTLHALMIGTDPDFTFILDVDPALALERGLARQSGEDRFEGFGLEFQTNLRAGFLDLAARETRCHLIDADRDAQAIADDIWARLSAHL
ncbi:MAG: dTMP kinase [Pseudomonadota bacterium]